jgi:catechol 2,3-dioxygenase-like lactoylglutathione lyase family enzyme
VARIDHIGIVVDDLDEAKRFLGETLGLDVRTVVDLPELGMTTAFFRCGDADIELIGMADPEARKQRLGDAPARIEHVAILIDDLEEMCSALERKGVRLTGIPNVDIAHPVPFRVGSRLNVWTDPATTDGVIYQLIEDEEDSPR